jgi:hypothetical protein
MVWKPGNFIHGSSIDRKRNGKEDFGKQMHSSRVFFGYGDVIKPKSSTAAHTAPALFSGFRMELTGTSGKFDESAGN